MAKTKLGDAGYDNVRDNIDDHIKTKAISSSEIEVNAINLSGNNVGIGTASPNNTLHVAAAGSCNIKIEDTTATESTILNQVSGDGDFTISRAGTGGVDFGIQADGDMYLGMYGDVGIGDATPDAKLQINGLIHQGTGTIDISGSNNFNNNIVIDKETPLLRLRSGTDDWEMIGGTNLTFRYEGATKVTILGATGKVGIGTASPDSALHIAGVGGGTTSPIVEATTGTNYIGQKLTNTGGSFWMAIDSSTGGAFGTGTAYAGAIWRAGNYPISLVTNSVERLRVTGVGDVGIGTKSPDTKLQVVGDTKFGDDNTNYASFATDGELTLTGTARVNKEFSLLLTDFNPGASGPTKALHDIFPTFEFTIDDDMHTSFEMPNDWATGTDITCEVYWAIDEAYVTNSGEVRWSADWRAVATGEVISGGSSGTMDFGDVNIPATANTIVKTTSTIAGGSLAADDLVAFNGARVALVAGSNPTAEPYIIAVRLEYIADKLGEAT